MKDIKQLIIDTIDSMSDAELEEIRKQTEKAAMRTFYLLVLRRSLLRTEETESE